MRYAHGARARSILVLSTALLWAMTACQPSTSATPRPMGTPLTLSPGATGAQSETAIPAPDESATAAPTAPAPTAAPGYAPGTVIFDQDIPLDAAQTVPAEVQFDAAMDQVVRLDVSVPDGSLDYELNLVDKFGNFLAALKARPGRTSETISQFVLPFEGPYRVLLTPIDGVGTLHLTITASGPASGGGQLSEIPADASATISEEGVYHSYRFRLEEGSTVNISAEASRFGSPDVRLALYGPDGRFVTSVDDMDPPANLDAAINGYIVPIGGTYTAIVSNYGTASGEYTFRVRSAADVPQADGPPDIVYDTPYKAAFADQDDFSVTFDGTVGDVLWIGVTNPSDNLNVDVYLFSPFEQIIAFAAENLPGQNQAINEVQLPYTGRYRVELSPHGDGEGTLMVAHLAPEQLSGGGLIGGEVNKTLRSTFSGADVFHVYQFNGSAGDQINVAIASAGENNQLDIGLALIGPLGNQIIYVEDGQGINRSDPQLSNFALRQTGSYLLIVYTSNGSTGSYDLTFLRE